MQFGYACMECILKRYTKVAQKHEDEQKGIAYVKEILRVLADAPEGVAIPFLTPAFAEITEKYYGSDGADYEKAKRVSNEIMLRLLPELREQVLAAGDPLQTALALAQIANYIDFTALYGKVDFDRLRELFRQTDRYLPEQREYRQFCDDLKNAGRLIYICDNAGEIVADRLAAEQITKRFPRVSLTFAVRGLPAVNDALREDAAMAGLEQFGRIVDNGSGISGTQFGYLGAEMAEALSEADVILAKGQGNFETMLGCGYNVYYSFLCKCERFTEFFGVEPLTGMFINERRLGKCRFSEQTE